MNKVPNLRFKEFSGEWVEDELDNIVEISKNKYNPLKNQESYKCVELENLSQETGQLLGYFDSKDQQSIKNKFNKGQVLFGKLRPYLRKYWLAEFEGVCSSEIWVLEGKKISNDFLYRIIQTDKFHFISNISSGSKMPRADWSYMSEFPFYMPSSKEQEKIASFFSLIDKKIELQTQKVEDLKNYKKGIMQKIFSQELRFKDENGNEYPEWEERKLGQICEITTGKLDANAMIEDGMYRFYTCAKEYFQIDKYVFDTEALLISGNGANVGYIHYYNGKFNAYQRTYVLTNFKENILFVKHYLNRHLKRRILQEKNEGNTPYIVLGTLSEMLLKLPCTREQEKITQFLNPLEYKIEQEQEKLDALNQYKKGLLQQMFI